MGTRTGRLLLALAVAGALAAAGSWTALAMLARDHRDVLVAVDLAALEGDAPAAASAAALAAARELGAGAAVVPERTLAALEARGDLQWAWGWELAKEPVLQGMPGPEVEAAAVYLDVPDPALRAWLAEALTARWGAGAAAEVVIDDRTWLRVRGATPDPGTGLDGRPRPQALWSLPLGIYPGDLDAVSAAGLLPVPALRVDGPEPADAVWERLPAGTPVWIVTPADVTPSYEEHGGVDRGDDFGRAAVAAGEGLAARVAARVAAAGRHRLQPAVAWDAPLSLRRAAAEAGAALVAARLGPDADGRAAVVAVRARGARLLVAALPAGQVPAIAAWRDALLASGHPLGRTRPAPLQLPAPLVGLLVVAAAAAAAWAVAEPGPRVAGGASGAAGVTALALLASGLVGGGWIGLTGAAGGPLRPAAAVAAVTGFAALAARQATHDGAADRVAAAAGGMAAALGGGLLARALLTHPAAALLPAGAWLPWPGALAGLALALAGRAGAPASWRHVLAAALAAAATGGAAAVLLSVVRPLAPTLAQACAVAVLAALPALRPPAAVMRSEAPPLPAPAEAEAHSAHG